MITGYSVCSEQTAIPSILSILLSGAELTEYYSIHSRIRTTNSMYSHSRIVPKECALRNILPNPVLIQDTDLWWQILFANPVQFLIHKKKKKHVHIFEVENEISNIIHVTSLGESWEYDSYCILLLPPNLSSHTCTVSCDKWFEPRCITGKYGLIFSLDYK